MNSTKTPDTKNKTTFEIKNVKEKSVSFIVKSKKLILLLLKHWKLSLVGLVAIIVFLICIGIATSKAGSVTTVAESALKEVVETNNLSVLEYTYNSIATVYNEPKENETQGTERYHVSYDGKVRLGFDFNALSVRKEKNENNENLIIVDIPDITIQSADVDENSLDYIFLKNSYETETIYAEAYNNCVKDLNNKAYNNDSLKKLAYENAVETIQALFKPWEQQLPKGYTVEYR